jgi:glucokinase
VLQSRHGLAGTIGGHLPLVIGGRRCSCSNLGCAEAEASTAVLPELYAERVGEGRGILLNSSKFGFAELFEAADAGDQPARAVLERCSEVWSALTVALIHAYDPEVVVFGGSVLKRAADILPPIERYVRAHAWTPGRVVTLRVATLGNNAALLGAIPLLRSGLS